MKKGSVFMRKIWRALLATCAGAAICAVMTGCGTVEIELNDYIEVEYSGYDTIGAARYSIDFDAMIAENSDAFGLRDGYTEQEGAAVRADLSSSIGGSFDEVNRLTNGDDIEFTWSVNEEKLMESYPVTLIYSDMEYTVSGLEELKDFDPFEYIEVSFSGIAPDGQLLINISNDIPIAATFDADRLRGLRNGDTVTITAGAGNLEQFALTKGYKLVKTTQEYTVDGLSYYADELGQIPEELMEAMNKQAEDMLTAYYSERPVVKSVKGTELLGHWLLSEKEGFSPDIHNSVYCVYKVTLNISGYEVKHKDKGIINTTQTYYNFVQFNDIKIMADGSGAVDLNGCEITKATNNKVNTGYYHPDSWTDWLTGAEVRGYEDIDSMFSDCVSSNIGKYNYESTVK